MIELHDMTFAARDGRPVFDRVNIVIPGDRRVAVLGGMASGKTTLIQLLCGLALPTRGRILRKSRLSFPGGYQRGFRAAHSAAQNLSFAARIHGADPREVIEFVGAVTGLAAAMHRPMHDLSIQDRMNLSYALTFAIPFDTYLFDNSIGGTGDPAFRQLCAEMFRQRTRTGGALIATRHARLARELCDCALVIEARGLTFFDNLDEALARFSQLQHTEPTPSRSATNADAAMAGAGRAVLAI